MKCKQVFCKTAVNLVLVAFLMVAVLGGRAHALGLFEMGTEISYFNYEEPGVMEQDGMFYGIYGSWDVPLAEAQPDSEFLTRSVLGFDAVFKYGQVDYTSPVSGTLDDIDDYMFEISGHWGYQYAISENTVLTPYVGLGYRYLNDDASGMRTSVGHFGYERESNYLYLPLGVKTDTQLSDTWALGFNVEFDVFLYGKQKSHLEDVSSSLNTLENDQEDGYGLRGSVQLVRRGETIDFSIEPFVRWWDIDDSTSSVVTCGGTPCALGYEPKNESLDVGIRLGVQF